MQNVLADLALESEASLVLVMRIARALDHSQDPHEQFLTRLCVPVGKYWICKRTANHAYEAMECIGGSGVMEDSPMPRLFRESPVNAIWEGSGNIQCLDVLRAVQKSPETIEAFFAELARAHGANPMLDSWIRNLKQDLPRLTGLESQARELVDRLALGLQAALLQQHAPAFVADAFCLSRLGANAHFNYGALPRGIDCGAIIRRATPVAGD